MDHHHDPQSVQAEEELFLNLADGSPYCHWRSDGISREAATAGSRVDPHSNQSELSIRRPHSIVVRNSNNNKRHSDIARSVSAPHHYLFSSVYRQTNRTMIGALSRRTQRLGHAKPALSWFNAILLQVREHTKINISISKEPLNGCSMWLTRHLCVSLNIQQDYLF